MDNKRQESEEVEAENAEVMPKPPRKKKKKLPPKGHRDYWKERILKKKYQNSKTGKVEEVGNYSVILSHLKHREYFNLDTPKQVIAAKKAKGIDVFLKANGWKATLAKYKPEAEKKPEIETVGNLIEIAEERAEVRSLTFRQYTGAIRRIVAGVKHIESSDASKFRPGGSQWQVKVDKVKLSEITAEKVQAWRKAQLGKLNPAERKRKEVSLNSTLNQARSLWKLSGLPSPFDGLKWKQTAKRFQPSVEAPALLYWAEQELKGKEALKEEFIAFALCLFLGLRKGEADCLTWEQIDFENARVKIETTAYFKPKSENSEREIPVQDSILPILSKWREGADKTFVLKGGEARPNEKYTYYRAENTWKALTTWLKLKGVDTPKPIHYLRKLAGSLMYGSNDVYAAQRFLGHSDIRTTIGSYVHEGDKSFDLKAEKPEPKAVRS